MQSSSKQASSYALVSDHVAETIRLYGPVTVSQIVAICGPQVKPESARRRALTLRYTEEHLRYMQRLNAQQQIDVGRAKYITRIVCELHRAGKIKRIGGTRSTKNSEWVLSSWSVLDKGESNETGS